MMTNHTHRKILRGKPPFVHIVAHTLMEHLGDRFAQQIFIGFTILFQSQLNSVLNHSTILP